VLDDDARFVEDRLPFGHSGDQLEAREPQRTSTAQAAPARAIDQPGAGDQLGKNHRHGLQRLDLHILIPAWLGMLDGEHSDRAFEADYGHAGEAVEALLARLGLVEEGGMLGRFCKVEDSSFGGDGANEAFTHAQPCDVHRLFPQAMGREQLEEIVAKQIDGADVALHLFGNEIDDLVELVLRRAALRHDLVETGQYLPGRGGSGQWHGQALTEGAAACHAKR
jgi:hypothetical protein